MPLNAIGDHQPDYVVTLLARITRGRPFLCGSRPRQPAVGTETPAARARSFFFTGNRALLTSDLASVRPPAHPFFSALPDAPISGASSWCFPGSPPEPGLFLNDG